MNIIPNTNHSKESNFAPINIRSNRFMSMAFEFELSFIKKASKLSSGGFFMNFNTLSM